jgi:two-component system nitrogen regulation response regulator GlnG
MVTSFSPAVHDAVVLPLAPQAQGASSFSSAIAATAAPQTNSVQPAAVVLSGDNGRSAGWESDLELEALSLLATDRQDVWDVLTNRFETCLIQAALATTRGRRIEAALKLGIGRNTITRKIQELGIED